MSPHLSPQDRQALQDALQARRASLDAQQQRHLGGRTRAEHARDVLLQDADDATQRDADREVDLALTDREVVDLAAVDAALQRLAQGGYGLCAECGQPIPVARLKLAPEALRCVACESEAERTRPRTASM